MVTQYLLTLKRRVEGEHQEYLLSHPAFQQAMKDAQDQLQAGKATWHAYDDVFGTP
jgi:hypothetical protein